MGKPILKRTASKMNAKVFHYTDSVKPSNRLGHSGEPVRHETNRAISFGVDDAGEVVNRIVQTGVASGKILSHKTIVVRLTAGGRDGKKQGFIVGKMIAAEAARHGHAVFTGEPTAYLAERDAESGKPYVRDWEVSGTADAIAWLLNELGNIRVDVAYAMNGRAIRAMGATLGEKAELQAKESARRKAACKEAFAGCDPTDTVDRDAKLAALVAFQAAIPETVGDLKLVAEHKPEWFGPLMVEFAAECVSHGLNPQHYLN